MRFGELVAVSRAVAETSGRSDKVGHLASFLQRLAGEEIEIATAFLSGAPRQGRIGLGAAALSASRGIAPADSPTLDLRDVDEGFGAIQSAAGRGSTDARADRLRALLGPFHQRRAELSHTSGCGRPASRRTRRGACRRRREGGRRICRARAAGGDDGGRARDGRACRALGRRSRLVALSSAAVSTGATHARRFGSRCRRGNDDLR